MSPAQFDEQTISQFALPASYTASMQLRLANEGGNNISYGSVSVRQAVWPDPTVTIGPTETH